MWNRRANIKLYHWNAWQQITLTTQTTKVNENEECHTFAFSSCFETDSNCFRTGTGSRDKETNQRQTLQSTGLNKCSQILTIDQLLMEYTCIFVNVLKINFFMRFRFFHCMKAHDGNLKNDYFQVLEQKIEHTKVNLINSF